MTCKNNNTLLTAHNQSYGRVPLRTHTQELSATFDHQLSTDNTTFLSVSENCAHLEIQYKYRFDGGARCCALPYCHCLSFTFLFLSFFNFFFFCRLWYTYAQDWFRQINHDHVRLGRHSTLISLHVYHWTYHGPRLQIHLLKTLQVKQWFYSLQVLKPTFY